MRTGLLLVVLGLLWVAACTSTDITDEDCIVNGGICFTSEDFADGCYRPLLYGCASGYKCCTNAYAANFDNGVFIDAATGIPDGGPDAAVPDAGKDSGEDAKAVDAGHDAAKDAGNDVVTAPLADASKG